jgi:tetratricopeptide (TPR) repeat protein
MAVHNKQHQQHRGHLLQRRRTAHQDLSVDCNLNQLEDFLCHVVADVCQDEDLLRQVHTEFHGLGHRIKAQGVDAYQYELSNAVTILEDFLNSTENLDPHMVFDLHTYIGQVRSCLKDKDGAAASLTKALWIASSSKDIDEEHVAVTLHRLGKAYAQQGKLEEARNILSKALRLYKDAGISHVPTAEVKALLDAVARKCSHGGHGAGSFSNLLDNGGPSWVCQLE